MKLSRKLELLAHELGVEPVYLGHGQYGGYVDWDEDKATAMLTYRNPSNRPLDRKTSEVYGKAMRDGRFPATGQTISFDEDANLLDGQNRLAAVASAKVVVPILTVFNVNREECFPVIDNIKRRSLADVIFIDDRERKNRALLSGTILALYEFAQVGQIVGKGQRSFGVTNAELLEFAEWFNSNNDMDETVGRMASSLRCPAINAQGSAATALHLIFARTDKVAAEAFFVGMAESAMDLGEPRWDGGRKLVKRISQYPTLGKINRATYTALLIKSWNCYITASGMERLIWNVERGESYPQIEGVKYNAKGQMIDKRFRWPVVEGGA